MKIRVGGVPEHFNYPWHYAIKNGLFRKQGIDVEWVDVKGGSGAMCSMLGNDELDFALVLTEGIIKYIASGGKAKIVQQYVKSPLIWGIHASNSFAEKKGDLREALFARSRIGSGSHIMTYVLAEQNGWTVNDENFVTVGNIDGAVEAFSAGNADILLWEKFMTRPLVKAGKMKKLGDLISPWPCFVLVSSQNMTQQKGIISKISQVIIAASGIVTKRKSTVAEIAEFYDLKKSSVEEWYSTVEWQTSDWISSKMLYNVINTLNRVGLVKADLEPEKLCVDNAKIY
jgi:ABC-type nitrate/sulfonate/bicarbonate transport system substrate-binding protein